MTRYSLDGAPKSSGEPTREVAEGGAAKSNIVLDAVIVKMSSKKAIWALASEVQEATDVAYGKVRTIIEAETVSGHTMISAWIGNTMGIE